MDHTHTRSLIGLALLLALLLVLIGTSGLPFAAPTPLLASPPPPPTPTLPPSSYSNCQRNPRAYEAPHHPIKIVSVDKAAHPEAVRLENVSTEPVNLNNWILCSFSSQRSHPIRGTLEPGANRLFSNTSDTPDDIWADHHNADGALYTPLPGARAVSFWTDAHR
jgi:hypothetical protein